MPDISNITLPDGNTYNLIDASKSGVYIVIGTQTTATVNLTGDIHNISALYDGLTIVYYSPQNIQSSSSGDIVNLNLTLDDGTTTGAINCWIGSNQKGRYANTSDGFSSKCTLIMTYWSSAWLTPRWVILADTGLSLITRTTVTGGEGLALPIPMVSNNTLNTDYSLVHPLVPNPNNNEVLKFNPVTGNLITTQLSGTPISGYAKQVSLTQAEYDALVSAGTVDLVSTVYFITDGSSSVSADDISYDNTSSGLTATNVQDAIDEVNTKVVEIGNLKCYQVGENDTTFTFTHPNLSGWGPNYPHNIIVMGYKCYAFMNLAYVDNIVTVSSLGQITLSATKAADTYTITINASATVWGGLRILCVD